MIMSYTHASWGFRLHDITFGTSIERGEVTNIIERQLSLTSHELGSIQLLGISENEFGPFVP